MDLMDLQTPALILDENKMNANIERMHAKARALGVTFRPHLKTAKCWEVARRQMISPEGPATVSTLKEAEQFAACGVKDMIYAVGIAPNKLDRVSKIIQGGVSLKIILDSVEAAEAVSAYAKENNQPLEVLIEIDCDGHRSGLKPADSEIVQVAQALESPAVFTGLITHAGGSYDVDTPEALVARANDERYGIVAAKALLKARGFDCKIVSVGSTPTALYAQNMDGVTEMRAGVYVFGDLFQAGVGSCKIEDIACSLLVTVIGHQKEKGWVITDGGWMAMSRDRGTANQKVDQGYGLVCSVDGKLIEGLWMSSANQEHGIISARNGKTLSIADFPIGTRLRILPNHACPFAAQHDRYFVCSDNKTVKNIWPRFSGWL